MYCPAGRSPRLECGKEEGRIHRYVLGGRVWLVKYLSVCSKAYGVGYSRSNVLQQVQASTVDPYDQLLYKNTKPTNNYHF